MSVEPDRGAYPDARTPWDDQEWRAAALDWVAAELGVPDAEPARIRLRPWSVVLRIDTPSGAVWFKANPAASAFEPALLRALSTVVPDAVPTPLAVDPDRGWSLTRDGGRMLRDHGASFADWERLLAVLGTTQRALAPHRNELAAIGVPVVSTVDTVAAFDALIPAVLSDHAEARLAAVRPAVIRWSAELAAAGIPDSLDHGDLHDGQVLVGPDGALRLFDWGDALIGHPFAALLVPVRRAIEMHGPAAATRLRDAYLEPWTRSGVSTVELGRAAALAWRLAPIARASSWGRLFPKALGASADGWERERIEWLLRVGEPDPF